MTARKTLLWVAIATIFSSGIAHGKWNAGEFDSYMFSLSWEPVFCETKPDKTECIEMNAASYSAKNLVLHGLWPNKNGDDRHQYGFCDVDKKTKAMANDNTQWCDIPKLDLSPDTETNLAKFMPGFASCLERHEWYKHGTCSGLGKEDYFATATKLTEQLAATSFGKLISSNGGNTVSLKDLKASFDKDFGRGSSNYLTLTCNGNELSAVEMSLSKELSPNPDIAKLFIRQSVSKNQCPERVLIKKVPGEEPTSLISSSTPAPLMEKGKPVDWWFVFKFNANKFPGCGEDGSRECLFGGDAQDYPGKFSQQFVYASSKDSKLQEGKGCLGDTLEDPVGATFDEVYNNSSYYYVVWNDQFYNDPHIEGCSNNCASPWGHSKGMLAWDDKGEGFVMQVSTPSWPASGSSKFPRKTDGNTLGCITDNNVKVSQHFFSLKLTKQDIVKVLQALRNASVVTDPANKQIVKNGGPSDIQELVKGLGKKSNSTTYQKVKLSSKVEVISKPSNLNVPPWQLVSAAMDGMPIRTATWWANPKIYSTTSETDIVCWEDSLPVAGAVEIASSGHWGDTTFSLKGGPGPNFNHSKIGVSTESDKPYTIFGDLNQQGTLSGNCKSSQNGRGGLFFIVKDKNLFDSVTNLIKGETVGTVP